MIAGIDSELVRILIAASMFGTASFLDIRRREVSDLLWIFFGVIAVVIYALEFAYGNTFDPFLTGIPIIIAAAVSFGIFKSGLFGGADALALITLAAILPIYTGQVVEILPLEGAFLHPIVPLIVLSNTVILSVSMIGVNLASNALYATRNPGGLFEGLEHEPAGKKIIAAVIGYRTRDIPSYAFPMECTVGGKRQFSFSPRNAETAEYESRKNVWVTRGTPFLAFMLAGFLAMLFVGDIAGLALRLFL